MHYYTHVHGITKTLSQILTAIKAVTVLALLHLSLFLWQWYTRLKVKSLSYLQMSTKILSLGLHTNTWLRYKDACTHTDTRHAATCPAAHRTHCARPGRTSWSAADLTSPASWWLEVCSVVSTARPDARWPTAAAALMTSQAETQCSVARRDVIGCFVGCKQRSAAVIGWATWRRPEIAALLLVWLAFVEHLPVLTYCWWCCQVWCCD